MDENTFVGVWASSRNIPVHYWSKKYPRIDVLKRIRRTVSLYPCHPFTGHSSEIREAPSVCNFSHMEKQESSKYPVPLAIWDAAQDIHFFLAPPKILR